MISRNERIINKLKEIKNVFSADNKRVDEIDIIISDVISIIGENERLQRAYNEKNKKIELYKWAFKGIDQAYRKQVEENIELNSRRGISYED